MSEKKSNVPKLRFPGFTEPWEQRKLGEMCSFSKGRGYGKMDICDSGTPLILYGRLYTRYQSRIDEVDTFAIAKANSLFSRGNEVVVPASGETAEDIAVASSVRRSGIIFGGDLNVITPNEELDSDYLALGITYGNAHKDLAKRAQGKSVVHIHNADIAELEFAHPTLDEQRRISSCMLNLDHLITLHQRKLEHLQKLKKGLLQKMFPKDGEAVPEIRFPGFTDLWEQRKLMHVSRKVAEKNARMEYSETLTNSAEFGIVSQSDFFDKGIANENNIGGYYIVQNDDFVYNPRISAFAPVGPIKRNKLGRTGIMSPLYYVFRTHDIDQTFLEFFFSTAIWHRFMKLNGDSGARSDRFSIKDSVFQEMPIPYPPAEDEQRQIGAFFQKLDDLITLHQRKAEHLQKLKKGLLQQMFV